MLFQGTILHSLWNYIPDFPVLHADDITIVSYIFNAVVKIYDIAKEIDINKQGL